jgi:hypothetical protein
MRIAMGIMSTAAREKVQMLKSLLQATLFAIEV